MRGEIGQSAAADFLMPLGQLPRHRGLAVAEDLGYVGERSGEPRRTLEKYQRSGKPRPVAERAPPRCRARWQKAGEQKYVGRQAGQDQRGHRRGRPRRRRHRQVFGQRRPHQLEAGIGDERRAGVGNQRQPVTAAQRLEHGGPYPVGVVVVIGVERRSDAKPGEQAAGDPGVLAQDAVDIAQHPEPAQRDVAEIADRRRDEMKTGRQRVSRRPILKPGIGRNHSVEQPVSRAGKLSIAGFTCPGAMVRVGATNCILAGGHPCVAGVFYGSPQLSLLSRCCSR